MTSSHITIIVELSIEAGDVSSFERLMAEMVESIAPEPGTLAYEWMLGDGGRTCHMYERYADSAALVTHLRGWSGKFASRFLALAKPTRVVVYAHPDAETEAALAAFSPTYLVPRGGFHR
jgi:quinol monooxygenase YgiN